MNMTRILNGLREVEVDYLHHYSNPSGSLTPRVWLRSFLNNAPGYMNKREESQQKNEAYLVTFELQDRGALLRIDGRGINHVTLEEYTDYIGYLKENKGNDPVDYGALQPEIAELFRRKKGFVPEDVLKEFNQKKIIRKGVSLVGPARVYDWFEMSSVAILRPQQ